MKAPSSNQSRQPSEKRVTRLSVNMNAETTEALKALAESRGDSYTETVRRAISVLHFLDAELRLGRQIIICDEQERTVREVVFT